MLYIIVGNDYSKIKKTIAVYTEASECIAISSNPCDYETLDNYIGSRGLFDATKTIIIKNIFSLSEEKSAIHERIADMLTSPHIFLIIEDSITPKEKEEFKNKKVTVQEFSLREQDKRDTTLFKLADYYRDRDKKNLWLEFCRCIEQGKPAEEIHGILWWQIKTLLAILLSGSNPGLHPFVYEKNKRAVKNFSLKELQADLLKLLTLYHQARKGQGELAILLEQYILELFTLSTKQKVSR